MAKQVVLPPMPRRHAEIHTAEPKNVVEDYTGSGVKSLNGASMSIPGQVGGRQRRDYSDLEIDGLGRLGDAKGEEFLQAESSEEGEGNWVVILNYYVSGAKGVPFVKGRCVRASKLITGWGTTEDAMQYGLIRLKKLFEDEAIRLAAPEEIVQAQEQWDVILYIRPEAETSEVQDERARRIQLEAELKALRFEMFSNQVVPDDKNTKKDTGNPTPNQTGNAGDFFQEGGDAGAVK